MDPRDPSFAYERDAILDRLSTLRVAKELFLSRWYDDAVRELFGPDTRETLRRISAESRMELDSTLDTVQRWRHLLADEPEHGSPEAEDLARVSRRDFLNLLIETKDATAELYERAALLAPPELRDDFLALAGQDYRHAADLRRLLLAEVDNDSPLLNGRGRGR